MSIAWEPAARLADTLLANRTVSSVWDRDPHAWSAPPESEAAASIASRLGWLDVGRTMSPHVERVSALGQSAKRDRVDAVYLLGMGGSSLCAEVLRSVHGVTAGYPQLFVLDTTDESAIAAAAGRMDPERTRFVVASKSGGTVEVASLERFFWSRMAAALGRNAGRHFIAITDPGTALEKLARGRGYGEVFVNPPDIGGRFSALSLFGLVPAALIGVRARDLLSAASAMADGCRQENHANAGLELGAFIAAGALHGRDKLTVVLPTSLMSLGLWIEQLVAESTGKHGKGSLPVVDEPLGKPDAYGRDRIFVGISTDVDSPDAAELGAIEAAGHPVLRLSTRLDGLGAEFFRWEFATAIAGAGLQINPFDEPNVSEAKEKTKAQIAVFTERGRFEEVAPSAADSHVAVTSGAFAGASPAAVVQAAIDSLAAGDYAAFLSYLPATHDLKGAVDAAREAIRARTHAASTYGVGPRYLHSTGQYHKGGPNTVVAFVLTADDATETAIPEAGYSFAVLKRAQALGDVETLQAHDRRTVRIHFKRSETAVDDFERLFAEALAITRG
jgi:glucose-6-phosphate isomerase